MVAAYDQGGYHSLKITAHNSTVRGFGREAPSGPTCLRSASAGSRTAIR